MGSYREIKGDLLDLFDKGEFNVIAHGANCCSVMGAGIALQIKKKFPKAYYCDLFDTRTEAQKFGSFSVTAIDKPDGNLYLVYNLYTQYHPGPNAELTALKNSLRAMCLDLIDPEGFKIGLPLIGCGIGGLDFETQVKPIIKEELKDMNVTICKLK